MQWAAWGSRHFSVSLMSLRFPNKHKGPVEEAKADRLMPQPIILQELCPVPVPAVSFASH